MEYNFPLENEYIELYKLLKLLGICESGGQAKIEIEEGYVSVNGEVEFRKRNKIRKGSIVEFGDHKIIVE